MTKTLKVDEQSWVRRAGDRLDVRLRVRGTTLEAGVAQVELSAGSQRIQAPAEVTVEDGFGLVAFDVELSALGSSPWQVAVRLPAGSLVPISARLLAAPTLPAALLPGPVPETRLPPPAPRRRTTAAGRLVSRVGRRLPPPAREALLKVRDRGRELARRRHP